MELFGFYKPSYILLIPTLIFVIIEVIEIWLTYYYNRHCTNTLLADGYYPEENDEYSIALLKEFTYIPYTNWLIIGAIIFIIWVVQYFRFYNF